MEREIAATVAAWRRADERLYPVVMIDPERYTRMVSVIRAAADRLHDHDTVPDLVAARHDGNAVVAASCAAVGVPLELLGDVEAVTDAAFALRHRELEAEHRRRERIDAVATARTRGDTWVTMVESGNLDQPGVTPFQRIDMCLADGTAIRAAVDVDPDSYRAVYSIEHLRLDPATGALAQAAADGAATFDDRDAWEAAIATWRIGTGTVGAGGP